MKTKFHWESAIIREIPYLTFQTGWEEILPSGPESNISIDRKKQG